MKMISRIATLGVIAALAIAPAVAQIAAPTAPTASKPTVTAPAVTAPAAATRAKPAAAAPTEKAAMDKPTKAQRTAKSMECSKEADVKKIHGKVRKTFMSTCKKA